VRDSSNFDLRSASPSDSLESKGREEEMKRDEEEEEERGER